MTRGHIAPDELRAWRKGIGATQREAALALGSCLRSYVAWETGKRRMSPLVPAALPRAARRLREWQRKREARRRRRRLDDYRARQAVKRAEAARLRGERDPAAWW